jgi:hypothetical protein
VWAEIDRERAEKQKEKACMPWIIPIQQKKI